MDRYAKSFEIKAEVKAETPMEKLWKMGVFHLHQQENHHEDLRAAFTPDV